jgi:hypothetical protein
MENICEFEIWKSIEDNNIRPLDHSEWLDILKANCQSWSNQYLQLYKPLQKEFEYGIVSGKGFIKDISLIDKDKYPNPNESFRCWNNPQPGLKSYILIPFDGAKFGIQIKEDICFGYYNKPVSWLKTIKNSELWTDSICLLIREDIFLAK